MNKREATLSILETDYSSNYIPAGFFLHFGAAFQKGKPAVDKHLEFFNYTGMDIVKIQYEHQFPKNPDINDPDDWEKLPVYKESFFEEPLAVVKELVEKAKDEALVLVTLYSPFMVAGQVNGQETISRHIMEDPEKAKIGISKITESMLTFVRACVRYGVDGFYHSTQGAEAYRFPSLEPFNECIKPYDLQIMKEVNETCLFNILHICDYHGKYGDLSTFKDYPGDVVNCSLEEGERKLTGREVASFFNRPFMGGLDRKKEIATGTREDIKKAVENVFADAPDRFFLGADCTVPGDTSWDNLKYAIDLAHNPKR